jgi:nicotinamidase-related amidase
MWSRPTPDAIEPGTCALIVFDMLERFRDKIVQAGALEPALELVRLCRERGILICYARGDHRADGADFAATVADTDPAGRPYTADYHQPLRPPVGSGSPEFAVVAELAPQPADIDIPKHRWSAFNGTVLDTVLRVQNRDTILIIGGSTHVGIASTAYAARDLDYQVIVVRDACTGFREQREFFLDQVFPRMCRVRTISQVRAMLPPM